MNFCLRNLTTGGWYGPWNSEAGRAAFVVWAAGVLGFCAVLTQLVLMRELLVVYAGNELVLGALLGHWLLWTAAGAGIGGWLHRRRRGASSLGTLLVLVAVFPLAQICLARALRLLVFGPGVTMGVVGTIVSSGWVLLPFCLASGAALAVACGEVGETDAAAAIGRVYLADALGSVLGGLVFAGLVEAGWGHFGVALGAAIAGLAAVAALESAPRRKPDTPGHPRPDESEPQPPVTPRPTRSRTAPARRPRRGRTTFRLLAWDTVGRWRVAGLCVLAGLGVGLVFGLNLEERTLRWQHPGEAIRFWANTGYGRVVMTESAGQRNLWQNGVVLPASHLVEAAEEGVHYPMSQRPSAQQVLLIGGILSGAVEEVLKYPRATVTCVELDPVLIEAARETTPEWWTDPRVRVVQTDGRRFLQTTTQRFEVVLLWLPDPSTALLNRYYTEEFFREVKRAIGSEGVLGFGLGHYANFVSPDLARLLSAAGRTVSRSFSNVLVLPGQRVRFLASDGVLDADIASRLEAVRLRTLVMTRPYLEATLRADRREDLERAMEVPARINTDTNPVLYHYYARHWLGQFSLRFGWWTWALAGAAGVWILRLRGRRITLFASGFTALSIEFVLLLGYQSLRGSLYREVSLLISVFMAGLVAGAWLARQCRPADHHRWLPRTSLGLALFCSAMPGAFSFVQAADAGHWASGVSLGILMLILAILTGMQLPLAGAAESGPAATVGARLYTADLVGAAVGAFLASTVLLPQLGLTATCWGTAGLNLWGALAASGRRSKV